MPAQGQFLVAARHMGDTRFRQSVVLLLAHGVEGSQGVIVNRPTPVAVRQLLPDLHGIAQRDDRMYFGGPVAFGEVTALVRTAQPPPESREIISGVYYTASRRTVEGLLDAGIPPAELRLLLGYAGWAPGQLDAEIARGDWVLTAARTGQVFEDDSRRLWDDLIRQLVPPGTAI